MILKLKSMFFFNFLSFFRVSQPAQRDPNSLLISINLIHSGFRASQPSQPAQLARRAQTVQAAQAVYTAQASFLDRLM